MAFLSHSIPWAGLAALFEHRPARSGPGPQEPGIVARGKDVRTKQLEHFALKFQDVVREHAAIERGRFDPAARYVARAKTWTQSSTSGEAPVQNSSDADEETRRIFPSDFASLYLSYVPSTSGGAYGRRGLVEDFVDIATWIDFSKRAKARYSEPYDTPEDERNRIWLDEKSCSDIVRLLIIDSATTKDAQRRHNMLETVFLLNHHPDKPLRYAWSSGMACCNIEAGISRLITQTIPVFLFLNLVWTLVESKGGAESPLLKSCGEDGPVGKREHDIVPLIPRPSYMNTVNYEFMFYGATYEHGHCVEAVLFNPLFAPYEDGRRCRNHDVNSVGYSQNLKRYERDVFSDMGMLKDALKSMWKVLVYCDMIFTEAECRINWEFAVMSSVSDLFQGAGGISRILGQSWTSYEAGRMYEEGWRFYDMDEKEREEFKKRKAQRTE